MKVLIAYAGKTGTTAKCAKILTALMDDATLCDLTKEKPNLSEYGCIIVGGSIRMGVLHKTAKTFIQKNKDELLNKKCGFFICNCFPDQSRSYLEKNIPNELLKKAVAAESFGGELMSDQQKGMDRFITKLVSKNGTNKQNTQLHTSSEAMNKFAEKMAMK